MTAEVIAQGDDERPPRRPASVVVGVAALVALVAYGISAARDGEPEPAARPSPTPSLGWTEYPGFPRGEVVDPFREVVSVQVPTGLPVTAALLPGGVPGFVLVRADATPYALHAIGGPFHDQVLLGWCEPTRTFEDAAGTYRYDAEGAAVVSGAGLVRPPVRPDPDDDRNVEVGLAGDPAFGQVTPARAGTRCPVPLTFPPLPGPVESVHDAVGRFKRVRGRYVVSSERAAFCAPVKESGCADQGWERYGPRTPMTLPGSDLAGSYTWEGRFLVRAGTDGDISVVRLADARLVRRETVGVDTRIGLPVATYTEDGVLHLRFNPFRHASGTPDDDSPPGPPPVQLDSWANVMEDVRGGVRDYVVRKDAEIVLGFGVTGIGAPAQTGTTLTRWVRAQRRRATPEPLWLVLDARGHVLRAVIGP